MAWLCRGDLDLVKVWRHSLARSMAQGVTNTWTGKTVGWTGGIPAF